MTTKLRNIAIIAHVDHGKTTLVDQLLQQSGSLGERNNTQKRVMDSNDLERERGITILAKNTAVEWKGVRINIVDTPGHADFGGEVERILSMVDSVLLLVDAVDGPMPQTRFVTQKAFAQNLRPIVVINKIDRDNTRPDWVLDQTFDLFDKLDATDEQLDFPVVYSSALAGFATLDPNEKTDNMDVLFDIILDQVPEPNVDPEGPFQMQISALDYSSYVGIIGIGRIQRGSVKLNEPLTVLDTENGSRKGRLLQILGFDGLTRVEQTSANAGDIICVSGIDNLHISDTLCSPDHPETLPPLSVDEPTVSMTFQVNDSAFAGQDGKFITNRHLRDRLDQELLHNVALRVEAAEDQDKFRVSGRGELHLAILIENMRREGYELGISRPEVIIKTIDGVAHEPFEQLTIDIEDPHQGKVMEALGERRAILENIQPDDKGRIRLDYIIPSRGLIGFRTDFLSMTSGTGLLYHTFKEYAPCIPGKIGERINGALISKTTGKGLGYSLFNLQERGRLFIDHGTEVYTGMIIGIHSRDNDLVVNPTKAKQLNNIRAAGTDENLILTPPIKHTLEQALEWINDDELVEVTPKNIRLRKKLLDENARKRASKPSE